MFITAVTCRRFKRNEITKGSQCLTRETSSSRTRTRNTRRSVQFRLPGCHRSHILLRRAHMYDVLPSHVTREQRTITRLATLHTTSCTHLVEAAVRILVDWIMGTQAVPNTHPELRVYRNAVSPRIPQSLACDPPAKPIRTKKNNARLVDPATS